MRLSNWNIILKKENGKQDLKTKLIMKLRKVSYQDEQNRYYDFLTNNFDIEAEDVAFLYKKIWGIEILFKVSST